jgi:hypothetical protein
MNSGTDHQDEVETDPVRNKTSERPSITPQAGRLVHEPQNQTARQEIGQTQDRPSTKFQGSTESPEPEPIEKWEPDPTKDYYGELELQPGADENQIKKQYRKMGKVICL